MFQNAAKGIKKIYLGEILALIGAVLTTGMGVFVMSGNASTALTVVGVLGIVVALVGSVISLLGINNARPDDRNFGWALYLALGGIVLRIVASFFEGNLNVTKYLNPAAEACELFTTYYVLTGIMSLAKQLSDEKTGKTAQTARNWLIGVYFADIVVGGLAAYFAGREMATWVIVVGLVNVVLSVITYVIYLKALGKAKTMLKS